jgi:uncharacterized protein YggU (UPF0235/DUF167 family)
LGNGSAKVKKARTGTVGRQRKVLKVKVGAVPVEGLANRAPVAPLVQQPGLGKGRVEIVSGESSRVTNPRPKDVVSQVVIRTVRIQGLSERELRSGLISS